MNFIPRLEWNDISITGDIASGSAIMTNVASTANVQADMVVKSAYFPDGTRVISKTTTTVTFDTAASNSLAAISFALCHRLTFTYPSVLQGEPEYAPNQTISQSLGGVRQVQTNSVIKLVTLEFKFIPVLVMNSLRDKFYLPWGLFGKPFRYYESYDETEYEDYELEDLPFRPMRDFPKRDAVNDGHFLYKASLKFRRIYL